MNGMIFKFLVIFIYHVYSVSAQEVQTKLGKILGKQEENKDGTPLYVFLGIPYAIQPVGDLRFKDPLPITEPYGFLEANRGTRCVQYLPHIDKVIGKEECLHLNIYTTTLDKNANHDVVVFIHGGGFYYGAAHSHTPEYLLAADKGLVFVNINYRLGAFGFLSTEDDVVPGNMGLKDQVRALEWVKENIRHFGGNPENVVLTGMSAGGTSVHLHYLSPMSRNLFSRGISMSAAALSRLVKTKNIRKDAENLAQLNGCPIKNSIEMVDCLRGKHPIKMTQVLVAQDLPWEDFNSHVFFGPVIEKGGTNPFLDEHPFHILRKGKVKSTPWLVSATTAEGIKPAGFFVDDFKKLEVLDKNWNSIAPYLLLFEEFAEKEDLPKISEQIRKYYLQNEPISEHNRNKLIKLIGDRLHMTIIENSVRLHATASRAPVYMYIFDYRGKQSFSSLYSKTDADLGVSHGDDLIYLLKMQRFDPLDEDEDMNVKMMTIWISFIRNGIPDTGINIPWPPVSRSVTYRGSVDYVMIKSHDHVEILSSTDLSERIFWDSLPLNELHISGDLYIPKYIQDMQKISWIPGKDELIKARLERRNPLTWYLLRYGTQSQSSSKQTENK